MKTVKQNTNILYIYVFISPSPEKLRRKRE